MRRKITYREEYEGGVESLLITVYTEKGLWESLSTINDGLGECGAVEHRVIANKHIIHPLGAVRKEEGKDVFIRYEVEEVE